MNKTGVYNYRGLRELALDLFEAGTIKFGAFKLKLHETYLDVPLSPIYIDLRILRSEPKVMDEVVEAFKEKILKEGLKFDLLSDVPTAATPIVSILMHKTEIPMISPKMETKTHGIVSKIEGKYEVGQTALLVDDLVTKADSKLEAIKALEDNGLVVKDVLVLVDREQGGSEQLESSGYHFHTIFTLTELLKIYLEEGKISQEKYDETINYLKAN